MFNLDTANYVIWGYKNPGNFHTHSFIHEGFYRALSWMGKNVRWLDDKDDICGQDFSNTFFISNHDVAHQIPLRNDCFYLVHGLIDHTVKQRFDVIRNCLSWNVYINPHADIIKTADPGTIVMLDEDMPFWPKEKHLNFRWATDRMPDEIEHNKFDANLLNTSSSVINYVGTYWFVNDAEIKEFGRACNDSGIQLRHLGGGQEASDFSYLGHQRVVSPDENVRLVRESYFAPAIVGSHHLTEGYAPCRIFKNISYGQFGVTNSAKVNEIFGGKLIFNPDPYKLFFEARERLADTPLSALYELMDEVAAKHTYVNRLNGVFKAVQMTLEG